MLLLVYMGYLLIILFDVPHQGDVGEKGPEGAPGKDGGRVSVWQSLTLTLLGQQAAY